MTKNNKTDKKAEVIKSLIHIEQDEPYVKLSFNPGTGSFGFDVKAKTLQEAMSQVNEIINQYGSMMKTPEVKQENFV